MYQTSGSPGRTGPELRALVRETAERGALPGRGARIEGIDFDHPAIGVRDIAIVVAAIRGDAELLRVPAAVDIFGRIGRDRGPELTPGAGDTVAAQRGQFLGRAPRIVHGRDTAEVTREILLAGQIGAPRRVTVGAVVDRAARARSIRRKLRDHVCRTRRRSRKLHLGQGVNAPVEARALLVVPVHQPAATMMAAPEAGAAVLAAAVLLAHDFDHADAVQVELALHFLGYGAHPIDDGLTRGMQEGRCDRLVVEAQQSALGLVLLVAPIAAQAEEIHAVVVVARAQGIGRRIVHAGIGVVGNMSRDRIAERVQHVVAVTARKNHGVLDALGHRVEIQLERAMRISVSDRRCRSHSRSASLVAVPPSTASAVAPAAAAQHVTARDARGQRRFQKSDCSKGWYRCRRARETCWLPCWLFVQVRESSERVLQNERQPRGRTPVDFGHAPTHCPPRLHSCVCSPASVMPHRRRRWRRRTAWWSRRRRMPRASASRC